MRVLLGLVLALAIGAGARMVGIPVPAPPALIGALLVVAMTVGYLVMDRYARDRASTTKSLCGGPTGETQKEMD